MSACVRAWVRKCVHACARACVRLRTCVWVYVRACVRAFLNTPPLRGGGGGSPAARWKPASNFCSSTNTPLPPSTSTCSHCFDGGGRGGWGPGVSACVLCVRARVCVCVCLRPWRLCLVHPDTPVTPFALPADTASTSSALDNPDQRITADLGEFAAKVSAACLVAGSFGCFLL